jgi:hypothetical protein
LTASSEDRLTTLFVGLYGETRQDLPQVEDARLAALLAQINPLQEDPVAELQRQCVGHMLSARQIGVLRVSKELLRHYFSQPIFDPAMSHALFAACGPVLAEALTQDGWLLRPQHPRHGVFQIVEKIAAGWHPGLPQAPETLKVLAGWLCSSQPADAIRAEAERWWAELTARQEKVAARVTQSEVGALRLGHARQAAARALNRILAGRTIPDFMEEGISRHWAAGFQWVLLNQGERSPVWQRLTRGFALMVWTLQPEAADSGQKAKLTRVIDQVREELLPMLEELISDGQIREQLREQIEIAHLSQLHNRPMEYAPVPPVEGGSLLDDAGAAVSQDLLAEVAAVSPGDWFVETGTGQRFQLLLKLDEYQQLLFVNQLGIRQVSASFEEFAWQFSSAKISAVVKPVPLIEWSSERLNGLAEEYRQRRQAQQVKQQKVLQSEAKATAEREAARLKAQQEAARLSAAQQQQADEQAAQHEAQAEFERNRRAAAAAGHGSSEAQRRQRARLMVSGLTMGAWLLFHDETGASIRRKLAVVLPSSGKYIFVDRGATDKYEISRDGLIAAIAEGAVDVVSKDTRFDDALTRVVDGIRQERGFGDGGTG